MKIINIFLLTRSVFFPVIFICKFEEKSEVFYGEALGDYLYLPATFIYHNHTSIYEDIENANYPDQNTLLPKQEF